MQPRRATHDELENEPNSLRKYLVADRLSKDRLTISQALVNMSSSQVQARLNPETPTPLVLPMDCSAIKSKRLSGTAQIACRFENGERSPGCPFGKSEVKTVRNSAALMTHAVVL